MKRCYGPGVPKSANICWLTFRGAKLADVESLIRFHDTLLFLRAFPQSAKVVQLADQLLASLEAQVAKFVDSPSDAMRLDDESVSGIAGTTVTNTWTYELARWLAQRHPPRSRPVERGRAVSQHGDHPSRLHAAAGRRLVRRGRHPVPAMDGTAAGGERKRCDGCCAVSDPAGFAVGAHQLVRCLGRQPFLGPERFFRQPNARSPSRVRFFFHDAPLLQRKQCVIGLLVASAPLKLRKLSEAGEQIIDMARDALAVRYRELHGSTHGDPNYVFEAKVGRGVQLFIWGLDAEWRLPLRAYYAGFTLKNGVPINYFEAIGLFEWIEVGFNTFYAFREGETAWIYSKVLHLLHQLAGVTCFSVYPYQIGQDNEEAIQSGAFWFYRKLGFRPGRPDLLALTEREEKKIASDSDTGHRHARCANWPRGICSSSWAATRPAGGTRFPPERLAWQYSRKWRPIGRRCSQMRRATTRALSRVLDVNLETWNARERWAFGNFAPLLALVPGVARWTSAEKRLLVAIIRAKAGPNETYYLLRLQRHHTLREALLRLGSAV